MFPPPPKGRPIDNPYIDIDGNTWYYIHGQWTMVEPVDAQRWQDVQYVSEGTPEPPSYFKGIRSSRA